MHPTITRRLFTAMLGVALATVSSIAIAEAADSVALKTYKAEMAVAQRNVTLAYFASICGLRSDEWLETFQGWFQQYSIAEANRLHIGNDGLDAVDAQSATITAQLRQKYTCATLRNSQTLDDLDRLERKLSGGYH